MDINRPLPFVSMTGVEQIVSGHPVWRLDFGPGRSVVLKEEGVQKTTYFSDPAAIMRVVDPHAQTRQLSKRDLMQLRDWIGRNGPSVVEHDAGWLAGDVASALMPPSPGQPLGRRHVFFIMPMKQNLRNVDEAGVLRRGGDKSMVKDLHAAFKQPGTLEKLGQILAADAFIGNQDRVNFEALNGRQAGQKWPAPEALQPGEQAVRLECIQNPGNLFMADEAGRPTMLGLDTVDPGNMFKDLTTWNDGAWYPGQLLRTDAAGNRRLILQKVMNDLNTILGPRNRSFFKPGAKRTYMPSNAVDRMNAGMETGARTLLDYLRNRYAGGGMPPELQFRLHACGMLTRANFPRLT